MSICVNVQNTHISQKQNSSNDHNIGFFKFDVTHQNSLKCESGWVLFYQ